MTSDLKKKRGAVGFSLAAVLDDTSWYKELFLTTALAMVFFTVFVQGSTIKFLVRWHIWEIIILGCFYNGPSSVSVPNRKTALSQPELLTDSLDSVADADDCLDADDQKNINFVTSAMLGVGVHV